jgi:hypothetical protein
VAKHLKALDLICPGDYFLDLQPMMLVLVPSVGYHLQPFIIFVAIA